MATELSPGILETTASRFFAISDFMSAWLSTNLGSMPLWRLWPINVGISKFYA